MSPAPCRRQFMQFPKTSNGGKVTRAHCKWLRRHGLILVFHPAGAGGGKCVLVISQWDGAAGAMVPCVGVSGSKISPAAKSPRSNEPVPYRKHEFLFGPRAPCLRCLSRSGMRKSGAFRQPGFTDIPLPFTRTLPCGSRSMSTPILTPSPVADGATFGRPSLSSRMTRNT